MKNKLYLLAANVLALLVACNTPSNPQSETTENNFASLGDDAEFAAKHDEPKSIALEAKGEMISILVSNGEAASAYQIEKEGSNNYLIVIHEWWGLNDHIKREADIWYEKLGNANVIALDLYDGKVADNREDASSYMKAVKEERIYAILDGLVEILPKNAEIGTIGWCFGGGWSLKTALYTKAKACIVYYGMPVTDYESLQELESDVLFIYGTQDKWINEEVATQFEAAMKEANKEVTIMAFDADHAFANPTSERYVEEAAQTANQAAFEYLKDNL